ncbi:MAG: O-antigen ligase family protein [Nitrospinae bacterium]|nr:O-antigen ligase family protein [Nitrospinota bacterium]
MSGIVQPLVTMGERAAALLAPQRYREWLWFGAAAALLFAGNLLGSFGAAGVFGGYVFSLSLLGLAAPRRLLEVFVFLLALGHRDFTYTALKVGPANLYITEWVLLILMLAAVPRIADMWRNCRAALLALGLYAGIGFVFFWLSARYWPLGSIVRDFTIVYYAFFAVAALAFLRDAGDVNRLFIAMLAGSFFNLGGDLLNYLYGTFPVTPEQKNYSLRNSFYYLICTAYLLPGLLFLDRKIRPWAVAYVTAVFVVVLLYAYSKTAMAAILLISVLSILVLAKRARMQVLIAISMAFMLALIITPMAKTFKFSSLFTSQPARDDPRSMLRTAALRDFSEYPYGIGFGAPIFGGHSRELLLDPDGFHALHNSYLTVLRRMGVEGFAAFSAIVALALYGVYRVWRSSAGNYEAWLTPFAMLLGFIVAAVFATAHVVLEGPFFGAVFWLLLGAVFTVMRDHGQT